MTEEKENKKIKIAFESEVIDISLDDLIPMKTVSPGTLKSVNYKRILSSIAVQGVVEFAMVFPSRKMEGKYLLLDGHLRVVALKSLGKTHVTCLVSTDDESFTYNKLVNRLSPIQEHKMIRKAIDHGVPREELARVLDYAVASIDKKNKLLEGICSEAVDLLKDKMVAAKVFEVLKRMMPMRQIVVAETMNRTGKYSHDFARAMLIGSEPEDLLNPVRSKKVKGLSADDVAQMETEVASLQTQYQVLEESYGENDYDLTFMRGYWQRLLGNIRIYKFIAKKKPDALPMLQKIADLKNKKEAA